MVALVTSAHLVSFILLWARASTIGLDGSADVPSLLRTVLMQLFALTLGFAIAELVRSWFAVVLGIAAIIALEAAEYLPTTAPMVRALNPMHSYSPVSLGVPNTSFFVGHVFLLIGLICLLCAVTVLTDGFRALTWSAAFAMAGIGLASLGGGLVVAGGGIDSVVPEDTAQTWITIPLPNSGGQLVVTEMYVPVADDLARVWDRIGVLLEESDLAFTELRQDTSPDYGDGARGEFYRLDLNPGAPDIAAQSVETALNDLSPCTFDGVVGPGDWSLQGNLVVTTWLAGNEQFGAHTLVGEPAVREALDHLFALSASDAQRWIAEHTDNVTACSWDKTDFR